MAALSQFLLEDGVIASANLDFYRPASAPSHGDDRIRCIGTKGVIEVRDDCIHLINENGSNVYSPNEAPELLEEFLNGNSPISADEIIYLTKVSILARNSADVNHSLLIE